MSDVPKAEGLPVPKEDVVKDIPEMTREAVTPETSREETQVNIQGHNQDISQTTVALFRRLDPSNVGVTILFHQEQHDRENLKLTRLVKHNAMPSFHSTIVTEASKLVREPLIFGDRNLRCQLFWLPIQVRFMIYEALFIHDRSPVEIGRTKHVRLGKLALLRTCHVIYHEASIALFHCLSYRTLFLRTYGSFSAYFFRRVPRPLKCCRCVSHHTYLEYPCRALPTVWRRSFESIVFLLGSEDFKVAVQRRWAFSEFITTLRMGEALKFYSLTIVVTDNWKIPGFNEKDLVKALFSGAFEFLGQLRFRGFNEEERDQLCRLVHGLRIHTVRIERPKRRYQGSGFAVWICKFLLFFFHHHFRPGPRLETLEHKIYDRKENIPVWIGSFKTEPDHKKPVFVGRLRHNGTSNLTSIELTDGFMTRNPASK